MEVKIEIIEGCTLVKIAGRLDTATAGEFEKAIAPILEESMQNVILDCADFTYISSSGLRLFLVLQKSALAKGGKLSIRDMSAEIKSIFDMTGFSSLFTFEQSNA